MKPYRTLLFLLCVLMLLTALSWVMPAGGISLSKLNFSFPSFKSWFFPEKITYADISKIIADSNTVKIDSTENELSEIPDSLFAQTIADILHPLQFSDSPGTALWKFYGNLLANQGLIRVVHYGDSQIEGDRMTGYLRQKFQERFGGGGVGFIPAKNVSNVSLPVEIESEGDWNRFTIYGKQDTNIHHKKYGMAGTFARFSPLIKDTLKKTYEASIKLSHSLSSYKSTFMFNKLKVMVDNATKPVIAELTVNGEPSAFKIMPASNSLDIIEWDIPSDPTEVKIEFTSESSPDILGFYLDKTTGIAFDNIPMRGSSGTDFTRMDFNQLSNIFKSQKVGLVIYQFGVNVVPIEHEDYSFYENWVYSQLSFIKRLAPDVCVLVIGVSDMSKKTGENYISYPNIVKIRNAQKKAAFRAGCAFWDTFEAMGGENSMPSWVNADPTLASPDYTHFNHKGAQIIARMLYKALMYDYEAFMRKQPKKSES